MLTRGTLGLPGFVGALVLLTWAFCFLVLGVHGTLFHLLVPLAVLLILMQGVRRVGRDDGD